MKLEDMPTPETDACAKRCRDNLPFALASQNPIESIGDVVTAAHARMLEQRLALAVAALKECYSDKNAERTDTGNYLYGPCTESNCNLCRTPIYARKNGMHHAGIPVYEERRKGERRKYTRITADRRQAK